MGWRNPSETPGAFLRNKRAESSEYAVLFFVLVAGGFADTVRISGEVHRDVLVEQDRSFLYVHFPATGELLTISKKRTDVELLETVDDTAERQRLRRAWEDTRKRNEEEREERRIHVQKASEERRTEWAERARIEERERERERERRQEEQRAQLQRELEARQKAAESRQRARALSGANQPSSHSTASTERKGTNYPPPPLLLLLLIPVVLVSWVILRDVRGESPAKIAIYFVFGWGLILAFGAIAVSGTMFVMTAVSPSGGSRPSLEVGGFLTADGDCFGTEIKDDFMWAVDLVESRQGEQFHANVIAGRIVEIPDGTAVEVVDRTVSLVHVKVPGRGEVWTFAKWFR